jgi:cell fate regulator YaaT (PSP1 superfamily)
MDDATSTHPEDAGRLPAADCEGAVGEGRPPPGRAVPSAVAGQEARRAEVRNICRRHFAARNLPMRFVDVDFDPNRRAATIFFASDARVDFRQLSRDLCRDLRMRVTMHRLGPRDMAKRAGTCGPCGRALCCRSFLSGFPSVSVKTVKEQNFPLTPDRSAGMCGRLKCCLAFEARGDGARRGNCPGCCSAVGAGDAQGENLVSIS